MTSCRSPAAEPAGGARRLPDPFPRARGAGGLAVSDWRLQDGRTLRISRLGQGQRGLTFADLYDSADDSRPLLRGVARADCSLVGGRWIDYASVGGLSVPVSVYHLDASLKRRRAEFPMNPPVPTGASAACLRIGLLDNGVNYTRPDLARRLAYDRNGQLVGLDVWEGDGRPFDYGAPPHDPDPRRSLFNPRRHGSAVLSVLLDHAPASACVVPVRYPPFRSDGSIAEAVEFFRANGVRIVSVQSGRGQPWPEFRQAMEGSPEILFVVAAGNEGADLSRSPQYPASYAVPNMLVVAGSNRSGRALWSGSNWGGPADLIAFPAEDVGFRDFFGDRRIASGTSFSAPAVAGLAARLLSAQPELTPEQLKAALFSLAAARGSVAAGIPVLPDD